MRNIIYCARAGDGGKSEAAMTPDMILVPLILLAALELRHWLVPLCIGLAVFLVVAAEKAVFRRFSGGNR
jgi:hypothetical protein